MAPTPASPADDLITVRDLLRYAVSRFGAAKIAFGHGTTTALDEAAFILLEGLSLPIDDLAPWLEARLTRPERERLLGLIEARVTTRKPAPYLLGRAYIQGVPFRVDERVIIPRSYLGEMIMTGALAGDGAGPVPDPFAVERVLDLCTGSGCLAILAAMAFPESAVDAVDLSGDALEVAKLNVADHEMGERVTLFQGDLFAPLKGRRYDLIITNPPYVAQGEVDAFPAEFKAEPVMAHLGGADGLDIVRRILREAGNHLTPDGGLLCEIGTGRDILEEEFDLPFLWLDSEESEGEVFWLPAQDLAGLRATSH
ncbi:50S ribosomal protein L3 N(5)-glutamine methyltransferase [Phreatobacter sp.]|uniref:50S ribosomal protein L3 N(5)-glutamine methyltransferase n=1 Tax=Phreatobacter sp. TaxID=1966341 RepID=UPI0022C2FF0A|nr:50S ribosomal protein L3 N(5)-glutamine methyltransferase [Phreatobacter sp.]MCZ8316653.1 50S ribosomal protein L3 N(5)-glutamine methyltransferase [Phreatobacter sp.]